ncbi:hypothetical protein [Bacteroides eggerthii]|nr:hypothetical protein [Bacteroides eggerthii]MCG4759698.1 hypothetical protein [Bacteroides eggerthii]
MKENKPCLLLLNDIHISKDNIPAFQANWQEAMGICRERDIREVVVGGDLFFSRAAQTLDVLLAVRDMLVSAADHDIHVTLAEGNHDKVNQESLRGYCHVFDRHPNVTVVDEYLTLCRPEWKFALHVMSYFPEDGSFAERLGRLAAEALSGEPEHFLYIHEGINGALAQPSEKELPARIFSPFDKVFVGHYHNRTVIPGTGIEYIGSSRQHNFGEDEEKGYTVLYTDGTYEFVKNRVNMRYRVMDMPAERAGLHLMDELREMEADGRYKVKVRVHAPAAAMKSVDKAALLEAGAERGRTRVERIMGLETAIAAKREQIRTGHENVDRLEEQLAGVQRADEALQELEAGDTALEACLEKIAEMMSLFPDARQTDWDKVIAEKKGRLQTATERLKDCDAVLKQAEQELKNRTDGWEQFKKEYAAFCEAYRDQSDTTAERLREIDIRLRDLSGSIEELRHKRRIVSAGIDGLSNKLAGSITCPFCGHEFLVAEPQFDIEAGMKELKLRQRQLTEINGRIDEKQEETDAVELQQNRLNHERRILEGRRTGWEEQLAGHERAIRNATRHVEEVESGHKRIASEITALQSEIEGVRRKVFDEVFGFIDERNAALNRGIRVGKEDIQAAACAIDTLQATIRELDEAASPDLIQSLKDTLRETRGKSNEAAGRKTAVDARVRALEIQRERFVQFKTYLANTKIEALSRITNEFLQDIGSDIRIRFDGYTVLKSGKVREKISISLLRDGMDCGSFGKFSAGEAARVNLATILAMQKLVNSNCDGDKGLDLLVLDEILEAVDEAGLASMFEALNSLGGTVLVVSHGNVAEGYPHKLVIVKENGESRLGE